MIENGEDKKFGITRMQAPNGEIDLLDAKVQRYLSLQLMSAPTVFSTYDDESKEEFGIHTKMAPVESCYEIIIIYRKSAKKSESYKFDVNQVEIV